MKKPTELWYRLSIKRKLIFLFSLIIISISLLDIYTLINAFKYMQIYELDLKRNTAVFELNTNIKELNRLFEEYIISPEQKYISNFNRTVNTSWQNWNTVLKIANTNRNAYFQISAIRYALIAYIANAENTITYRKNDENKFIESLLKTRRIYGYIENYLEELLKIRLQEESELHSYHVHRVSIIRIISFAGIVFFSIVFLIIGTFFSESVTRPIRQLAEISMRMAEGNLESTDYVIPNRDELGQLSESFNIMSRNIREMVKSLEDKVLIEKKLREDEVKLVEMDVRLKEAQFLSLQSQISPHFLFNTLNTISRTSMFEKAPNTVKLIDSLANILRYTLNNQNKIVSLSEELNVLDEYMYIQKVRYGERLFFEKKIKTDVSNIKIPIFTIQPIVENALKYGIEPQENGGRIILSVTDENNGFIKIQIYNTGPGIPEDKIKAIISGNSGKTAEYGEKSHGIGIFNVKKRLEIFFKGSEDFEIISEQENGTSVVIRIPENV